MKVSVNFILQQSASSSNVVEIAAGTGIIVVVLVSILLVVLVLRMRKNKYVCMYYAVTQINWRYSLSKYCSSIV